MRRGDYAPSWHEELLPRTAQISQVTFAGLKLYLLTHWRQKEFATACIFNEQHAIFKTGSAKCGHMNHVIKLQSVNS